MDTHKNNKKKQSKKQTKHEKILEDSKEKRYFEKYDQLKQEFLMMGEEYDKVIRKVASSQVEIRKLKKQKKAIKKLLKGKSTNYGLYENSSEYSDTDTELAKMQEYESRSSDSESVGSPEAPNALPQFSKPVSYSSPITASQARKRRVNVNDKDLPRTVNLGSLLNPDGSITLPLQVGPFTIQNLGKIDYTRPGFHSQRYIYPIGYNISRFYRSTVDPDKSTRYTLTILDNGGPTPSYEIVADDIPNKPFRDSTSSGVWAQVIKLARKIRDQPSNSAASGPEYSGLSHPTVAYLIQHHLKHADRCQSYKWQAFNVINGNQNDSPAYVVMHKDQSNLEVAKNGSEGRTLDNLD